MGLEIEKAWFIDGGKITLEKMLPHAREVIGIEQASLPFAPREVRLSPGVLAIGQTEVHLSAECGADIAENFISGGAFPEDLEIRYRIKSSNRGKTEKLMTLKGNRTATAGVRRNEVEFAIGDKVVAQLRKLGKDFLMRKVRLVIPEHRGRFELNFYKKPVVPFVLMEREFLNSESALEYRMPDFIAALKPIEVAGLFLSDKVLASQPELAIAEFRKRVASH